MDRTKSGRWHELGWPRYCFVALALLTGFTLRGYCLYADKGFWFDDIYAASFANLSLWETVTAVLRFDVHPPTYYLQVNLWSRLAGHSDFSLQLNSVLWNCAALVVLLAGSLRRFGAATATAAVAVAAVMGSDLFFSAELRMYSMVSCLCLCAWIEVDKLAGARRLREYWLLILLLVVIGTAHTAGVVPASAVLLYAAPDFRSDEGRARFAAWFKACVIVGLALLPWIAIGMFRHAALLSTATWPTVSRTVGGWPLGYSETLPTSLQELAAVIVLVLLALAWALAPAARRTMACFIVWPILFVSIFSAVAKPLWYYRPFSFICPFVALSIGALAARLFELAGSRRRWLQGLEGLALALAVGGLAVFDYHELRRVERSEFMQLADYIRERAQDGEIVYVPDYRTFWGVARYLAGPRWGSAVAVQDPLDQDHSQRWPNIYRKLGPDGLRRLHLAPLTRRVDGFRGPLFIGWSPLPELQAARSFWEVEPIIKEPDFALPEIEGCAERKIDIGSRAGTRVFHVSCTAPGP